MPMSTEPTQTPIRAGDTVRLRGVAAPMVVEAVRPNRTPQGCVCICRHLTDSPTGTETKLVVLSDQLEHILP